MTHRLFVALPLPRPVREALRGAMGGVADARWQRDDQLHCTIRFIGEVDGRAAEDVALALRQVRQAPVVASLEGAGTFDRAGRIDTLWVGVGPLAGLRTVHAKVDRALVRAGLPSDARAYRPHVTIARFARSSAPAADVAIMVMPPRAAFRFEEMRLYESTLGREGAVYEVVERYPFG